MKRSNQVIIIFLLAVATVSPVLKSAKQSFRHHGISYVTSNYEEYKEDYAKLFRKVSDHHFKECFCKNIPKDFHKNLKEKKHTTIVIEPLYINLQNCTGIYAERIFGRVSIKWRDGHPHSLFLIDGTKILKVDRDTTKLNALLFSEEHDFQNHFRETELDSIYQEIKYGRIWTTYASILAPMKIKDKGKTIYDAYHE